MIRRARVTSPTGAGAALALLLCAGLSAAPARAEGDVAAETQIETKGFLYKEIAVDEASAGSGAGHQVTMRGKAIDLAGQEIRVGDRLRPATLATTSQQKVALGKDAGKIRILSIVPAINTPTCEQQTHYLSEKSGDLGEGIELVTISLDPPEAQASFAREAEIENVTFLSDAGDAAFGLSHGLLIEEPRILTRAVMVVDADNVVRYLQVVPELAHMPDMEAAFAFARKLEEES